MTNRSKFRRMFRRRRPIRHFFDLIRNDGVGYSPPDFALQVARLSEAAYRSASAKKAVKVSR